MKSEKISCSIDESLISSNNKTPFEDIREKEDFTAINKALHELPEKCREVFMLSLSDKLTYQEIADLQNIALGTVKTQMFRAVKTLQKRLSHFLTSLIL